MRRAGPVAAAAAVAGAPAVPLDKSGSGGTVDGGAASGGGSDAGPLDFLHAKPELDAQISGLIKPKANDQKSANAIDSSSNNSQFDLI